MKRTLQSALLSLGALVAFAAVPAPAHAQQTADTRWLPWLGCWQPSGETAATGKLMVCVRPATEAAGVEVVTINDGQTVSQRTLIADGQTHELNENGCTGWQRAAFSADGQRAYLRSDLTCSGGVHRTESAIMAMGSPTEWLDVQAVGMDGERVPRVVRYDVAPELAGGLCADTPALDGGCRSTSVRCGTPDTGRREGSLCPGGPRRTRGLVDRA
jgi:hypothetical protein